MKIGTLLFSILAISLMLGIASGNAVAQNVGDNSTYFTTYYSNANTSGAPDSTVRIINDGDTGGNLWASIYVFDDSQELQECCSCEVTPDGLLSESVNVNLTANALTGKKPTRGVIKVISSSSSDPTPTCQRLGYAYGAPTSREPRLPPELSTLPKPRRPTLTCRPANKHCCRIFATMTRC